MISVTQSAANGLLATLREKGVDSASGLRLSIERGGCAGLQYAMELGAPQDGDLVVEEGDARIFIDRESARHLDGCTLDYTDDLTGSGFRILNPRAVRSCGCGTSFEPAKN
jgi:iron-sulfur cluster assembly accessory protein